MSNPESERRALNPWEQDAMDNASWEVHYNQNGYRIIAVDAGDGIERSLKMDAFVRSLIEESTGITEPILCYGLNGEVMLERFKAGTIGTFTPFEESPRVFGQIAES